ncbi:unnamed protein product, partial [Prorocentrum cordatum]
DERMGGGADWVWNGSHGRLLLLKLAIASVILEMSECGQHGAAETAEGRLGCAIRCIRAAVQTRYELPCSERLEGRGGTARYSYRGEPALETGSLRRAWAWDRIVARLQESGV